MKTLSIGSLFDHSFPLFVFINKWFKFVDFRFHRESAFESDSSIRHNSFKLFE